MNWAGSFKPLLSPLLAAILTAGILIIYDQSYRLQPEPPVQPLAATAKTYIRTLPEAYNTASIQVKNGTLADKASVIGSLQGHTTPLTSALDAAFSLLIDEKGRITNAPAASDVLEQVATAFKAEIKPK
jgi:hypothetical protein